MAGGCVSLVGALAGRKTSQWLALGAQGCRLSKVDEAAILFVIDSERYYNQRLFSATDSLLMSNLQQS
jgi:hypothetical protein